MAFAFALLEGTSRLQWCGPLQIELVFLDRREALEAIL